ncbi:bifunctional 2',3'-cyclic-nucleotide 2'-phosphodiesterase/3'-nucleotidase [Bacillus rubiinfantis]|uniref:bifunctional 2',3'-cyclic-nucleotide 2'-phosphodiesterase/3'-nucleotidase n=1 Tax=Bacillus rubiinfantis TaxID=1499680 RepID=UPI0006944398|nr:bifunctional 2',3'-cyclic-nucleotide 2'-phosphodiesterase/3'-nucleotidase [Bacillus rubiinfantis]
MRRQLVVIVVLMFLVVGLMGSMGSMDGFAAKEELSTGSNGKKTDGTVHLRLLETSDLHVNLANYDYQRTKVNNKVGLVKTASLIKQARNEVNNSLLFDNGDHLQGNALGDYVAQVKGLKKGEIHPVYRAFNLLNYDAITLGNHEFNYGLKFLQKALKGAKMPVVNANVYSAKGDNGHHQPYFQPYVIVKKKVIDESGRRHTVRIGVIGFTPPQTMEWDREHLQGKVIAKSIVEAAQQWVPIMKKNGADIIIALAHTGLSAEPYHRGMENAAYYLTKVKDIDAVLSGHQHRLFPGPEFAELPNADLQNGTINGKPVVMPGAYGSHLGIIDLELQKQTGKWQVMGGKSSLRSIADEKGNALVTTDKKLMSEILPEHKATISYVNQHVGTTKTPIFSYFSLVKDSSSIQILNNAQMDFIKEKLKQPELKKYNGIPVLSATAPFKAGGRGGPDYYTEISAGGLALKHMTDLYVYPNTLQAVKVNGAQLKEWLEMSASLFLQIDPNNTGEQLLINGDFPSFHFDVIDGIQYQIDVTKPAKYDQNGNIAHPKAARIINLIYQGKPVTNSQQFIVAANNYRTFSTTFPGVKEGELIFSSSQDCREIVTTYIKKKQTIHPLPDNNWTLAKIKGKEQTKIIFYSSPKAETLIAQHKEIQHIGPAAGGFAKYSLDLSK